MGPRRILGRWKPDRSDTYARLCGGRVAKLQLNFAVAARDENRYHILDEREVASSLQDWLKDRHSLPEETAAEVAEKLAEKWRTGRIQIDQAPPIVLESVPEMEVEGPEADSDSQEDPEPPAAKVPRAEDRRSKYVIVELPGAIFRHRSGANGCWMGRRREFRNSQEFPNLPYTLCWPSGGEGQDSAGIFLLPKGAVKISKMGTKDPDVLGLQSSYSISFWISHFQPQKRYSPESPITF